MQLLPLIIAFAGGKGGVGKSTLSVCVGVEWDRRGLRILLVDADDSQRSILTWAEEATRKGVARPDVIALGDEIRTELPRYLERRKREGRKDVPACCHKRYRLPDELICSYGWRYSKGLRKLCGAIVEAAVRYRPMARGTRQNSGYCSSRGPLMTGFIPCCFPGCH